ncbi:MAG: hypothetical protein GX802_04935, partial [Clostridiales bacterium]|nr:hypothetical protein [Clostridiales bacterium]
MIYYPNIENSDIAAFDIFNPSQSASKISLYKKVTQQRQVDATMTTTVRDDGDKIFVDIDISKDSGAASGMITLSYSSEMLTYDSATPGSALNGFLVQTNGSVPGKIASAFAGSEIIPDAGGTMITYQFTKSAKAITGTLLVFDLVCNELIDTDTVTLLKVEAVGASYVVGGGEPTPPPTTPPPTTPPPTTPPPTTAPPTTPPADARILRTEFVSEVDNVVKVQVTISADSSAASGMYTLVYDPSIFTFKSHTQGAALSGFLVIANSENDGEVVVAFAGSEMIPNAGGVLGTFELTIKDGVAK